LRLEAFAQRQAVRADSLDHRALTAGVFWSPAGKARLGLDAEWRGGAPDALPRVAAQITVLF
jgi:hypothetical protein